MLPKPNGNGANHLFALNSLRNNACATALRNVQGMARLAQASDHLPLQRNPPERIQPPFRWLPAGHHALQLPAFDLIIPDTVRRGTPYRCICGSGDRTDCIACCSRDAA
jgi:hypothetical protein